jgi:hypothetical protein
MRWLCGCLIFFVMGCGNHQNINSAKAIKDSLQFEKNVAVTKNELISFKQKIKRGDIITRTGNDFTSQSLKSLNQRDKTFSHCGIANIENDSLFIYHAIGGEFNPNQQIKRESFEIFTSPYDNNAIGIFRFDIAKQLNEKIIKQAQSFYHKKIIFDLDFNLKTDDKMYCAEFIYKIFLVASDSTIQFHHSFIKDFEFVGVDDITLDTLSKKIEVYNYKLY